MIEILLSDLGGVVLDIDFELSFRKWSIHSGTPVETIQSGFSHDQVYEQHERGEIGSIEFYRHLCERIGMELSFEQFKEGWNDVLVAPFSQTVELLHKLAVQIPLNALSNSNPMHKQHWEMKFTNELEPFSRIFVSSDIGYRKPEADAYLHRFKPGEICTLWIALDDIAAEYGTMELVRGSHRWQRTEPAGEFHAPEDYRAAMIKYAKLEGIIPEVVPVVVPKGGGSLHHGWTWHGSGQNTGSNPRRSLVLHAMSSEVEFVPENFHQGNRTDIQPLRSTRFNRNG